MIIETRPNRADYTKLSLAIMIRTWRNYLYNVLLIAGLAYLDSSKPDKSFLPYVEMTVCYWLVISLWSVFNVRRAFKSEVASGVRRYEFEEAAIDMTGPQGTAKIGWDTFSSWRKYAGFYVLINRSGRPILALPQTTVTGTQMQEFESLLQKCIKRPVKRTGGSSAKGTL